MELDREMRSEQGKVPVRGQIAMPYRLAIAQITKPYGRPPGALEISQVAPFGLALYPRSPNGMSFSSHSASSALRSSAGL